MEARGADQVTEWVVEEDARLILLSPQPAAGAFGERRPGASHGVFPSSCSQSGMGSGDDDGGTTEVHRGRSNRRSTLGRADPEQGPP